MNKSETEELLFTTASTFVNKEISKDRIPSDHDIGEYLDHWLEKYERKNGDIITADDFEPLCEKLGKHFVDQNQAYERGNKDSYIALVRSKNLVSSQEYSMHKNINQNKSNHRIIYRDTEFPVDDNGYYILDE